MTGTRQERHKRRGRQMARLTLIRGGDPQVIFKNQLDGLWETAQELWGDNAQSMIATAFISSDPVGYLLARLPQPAA